MVAKKQSLKARISSDADVRAYIRSLAAEEARIHTDHLTRSLSYQSRRIAHLEEVLGNAQRAFASLRTGEDV